LEMGRGRAKQLWLHKRYAILPLEEPGLQRERKKEEEVGDQTLPMKDV